MDPLAATQPLPLRLLLDAAVTNVRRHFRAIYLPVAIPVAVASGLMPLAQLLMMRTIGMGARTNDARMMLPGMLVFFAAAVLFGLVYGLGYGALLVASLDALEGRVVSVGRAWLTMLRPKVLGTLILSFLAIALGTLLCILPGIYLGLIFCLAIPVMVGEGLFGTRALGRSAELMRYNPQKDITADPRAKAFLIFFVGALLGYIVSFAIQLPVAVVQQVMVFRGAASGEPADPAALMNSIIWLQVPTSMLGMMAQMAVQLYVSFGLALLFVDIRRRKEGLDLEAAIASIGEPART